MPNVVRAGLIQAGVGRGAPDGVQDLRRLMLDKHVALIEEAAGRGIEVLCLQELFTSPYFPAEQNDRWRQLAEPVPDGPTVRLMQEQARRHGMVMVVPVFEEEITGLFYNTAAVIDSDGTYLGKYRKNHLPHVAPGFWEKFYFRPGNLGYPVFNTSRGKVGVYICYDRHFPEGRGPWAWAAQRSCSTHRPRWPGCRSTCGGWNSRPTPRPTATSSAP